jgi:hypothetical protein
MMLRASFLLMFLLMFPVCANHLGKFWLRSPSLHRFEISTVAVLASIWKLRFKCFCSVLLRVMMHWRMPLQQYVQYAFITVCSVTRTCIDLKITISNASVMYCFEWRRIFFRITQYIGDTLQSRVKITITNACVMYCFEWWRIDVCIYNNLFSHAFCITTQPELWERARSSVASCSGASAASPSSILGS